MAKTDYQTLNTVEKPTDQRPLEVGNRFSWEQLEPQLKPLGIHKHTLSESDMRELLNARKTSSLQLFQSDKNGTVTPVEGRLFVFDHPGKGPSVELIPRQMERTPAPRFLGYQLSHEDHIRLMKTGEMGKAVPLIDKQTNQPFMGMIGYDAQTNRLTVFRQERFVPPTVLMGVAITERQREVLKNHGVIRVKDMIGLDKKPFTADVQVSAQKRGLKFAPVNEAALRALQEKRELLKNSPQLAQLSPKQQARQQADDQWKKTVVSAKNAAGEVVRKPAGELTYTDQIRVNKTTDPKIEWRALNQIPQGQDLKSPRAQAKMEILDYRKQVNGIAIPPKRIASKEEIQRAEHKFASITTGSVPNNTSQLTKEANKTTVQKTVSKMVVPVVEKSEQSKGKGLRR